MWDENRQGGSLASIDGLYRGFESFASWERLDAATCDRWDRYAAELRRSRQAADRATLARAVSVAVRAAAVDTGALEGLYRADRGFTLSVALQSFAWEDALEERGGGVRQLFEAQLAGYELAIDAVTRRTPLSEAWLRVLHERICGAQPTYRVRTGVGWQDQPLPVGRYKALPNHVRKLGGTYHAYAPVAAVAAEMHRLVGELRSSAFEAAHPVEQAAYAHHALTVVHPFADGNGRLARALASVYLYRALSVPLTLFVNHRAAYLAALAQADAGNRAPWLRFVAERGMDTMQLVVEAMRGAGEPDIVGEPRRRYGVPDHGRSSAEMENLALRLFAEAQYRWNATEAASPGDLPFRVNIVPDPTTPHPFQLESLDSEDHLDVRDTDLAPDLSDVLSYRLSAWIERRIPNQPRAAPNRVR